MKKLQYIGLSIACLAVVSCKKISQDYDKNPNDPTSVPSEFSLNASLVATQLIQAGNAARLGGMFTKTFTGVDRQYIPINSYTVTAPDFDDVWANNYVAVISNAKLAEDKAAASSDFKQVGIAKIIQAHAYGTFASLFGDIPFTEAVQPDKFLSPKFDPQQSVYAGIQKMLSDAIGQNGLGNSAAINPAAAAKDFIFGGNSAKWIAVAHSLKARYYLHTREYALALSEANQGISTSANDWNALFGGVTDVDANIYYDFGNNQRPGYMDASDSYAISLLIGRNNARTNEGNRLAHYFDTVPADDDLNYSSGIFAADGSFPMVTYSETKLIAAEAAAKLGQTQNAIDLLNTVRNYYETSNVYGTGSQYDSLFIADFNAGGLYNPGTGPASTALLKEILTERYLNLIGRIEQYNDIRRTKNFLGIVPRVGTKVPQRFLYPQAEINANANTPKQSSSDIFNELPIWNSAY
jgi:starch-binding outer membrane protein, SusD/RagB family